MTPIVLAAVELAPLAIPLIRSLVTQAQSLFGHGTGPLKLDTVLASVQPFIDALVKEGKLPANPDKAAIVKAVEAVVAEVKSPGSQVTAAVPSDAVLLSSALAALPVGTVVRLEIPAASVAK